MSTDTPTVLVVDDEKELADLYGGWLRDQWTVRVAYNGAEALTKLDETVDIALIDRVMPGVSGDDLVEQTLKAEYDCQIALVTAIKPDFDIIEMGFDEYIEKPIRKAELLSLVDTLLERATYDEQIQEYFTLVSKRATLEARKPADALEKNEAYATLNSQIDQLRKTLDTTAANLTDRDREVEFKKLSIR